MLTRRVFVGVLATGLSEAALAQRATVVVAPPGAVWLNANEFPAGPPQASIAAMMNVLHESNRYHYDEFASFYTKLAASLNLQANNILVGAGSSEVLHCAVDAFVKLARPFITSWPTFEAGPELTAAKGHPVVKIPLKSDYSADVKSLASAAAQGRRGPNLYLQSQTTRPHKYAHPGHSLAGGESSARNLSAGGRSVYSFH